MKAQVHPALHRWCRLVVVQVWSCGDISPLSNNWALCKRLKKHFCRPCPALHNHSVHISMQSGGWVRMQHWLPIMVTKASRACVVKSNFTLKSGGHCRCIFILGVVVLRPKSETIGLRCVLKLRSALLICTVVERCHSDSSIQIHKQFSAVRRKSTKVFLLRFTASLS